MMNKSAIIILLAISTIFFDNCARKTLPAATQEGSYFEDLTAYRPQAEEYLSPEPIVNNRREHAVTIPVFDVTSDVNVILDSMVEINRKTQFSQFTVQVHMSNSRESADSARLEVYRILPSEKPILEYSPPSYRVKVGRYLSQLEAYRTLLKLKEHFPNAIIVPEAVNFR
ncbi:MAG TPA: SPOR domain-containing protein [Cyclobacteriaceae bacterium]|nr:SPOR domain-containing protein [Cyclobacteriaceae bacterium]